MSENKGILVYCESTGGKLASIAAELLGAGRRLASGLGQELSAVLIGHNVAGPAREAVAYGAGKVYVIDDPVLKDYSTEPYLQVMEKVILEASPAVVLVGHTASGRDLAPWLGFRLNTDVAMDCTALEVDPDTRRLQMVRPVYGGNAQVVQVCDTDPQIATVRLKAMSPPSKDESRQGEIVNIPAGIDSASIKTRVLERKIEQSAGISLEEARVVIAGGRGIGSADGFKKLEELAYLLNGAVGASRPPCDKKWIPESQQIGLTGKIVSPELYLAVGLSGASQHVSGFSGARVIVAINKDPKANIFKVAHYGIISDWESVLPVLTDKLREAAAN